MIPAFMAQAAVPETSLPLETLLRLPRRGVAGAETLRRMAVRGDWQTRTLALSALGVLVRDDPTAWGAHPFRHRLAHRLPWVRHRFPTTGPHGAFVRGEVLNALEDRCWIVRVAAALAVGQFRDPRLAPQLEVLLGDLFRPVRLAAAAALAHCGAPADGGLDLLAGCEPAPARIGDTAESLEWLRQLAATHAGVLRAWPAPPGPPPPRDASSWASFLAGQASAVAEDTRDAEILRYAQGKDTHYNFTKPFHPGHRDQNIALLHSFLTVAENLRVPQGGRILDLGGGAAWVSELLAKIGYTPVTIDLSTALLRVGRDRFQRENLVGRFAAADMTALPFASGSFDAVVVIDALHHVPEVPAVFREAHRVLVQGGQFLFAEAGEGHSESDKSRGEMAEHGVAEREIHIRDAARYAREAGFGRVHIVPHFITRLTLTPEDLEAAVRQPSEKWQVWEGEKRCSFDTYLLQSIFCHPVMVFQKGERTLDSRMPRVLKGAIDAKLTRDGARVLGRAVVRNQGDTLWLRGSGEPGRVRLGFQLLTRERRLLDLDFARAELPTDVPAGGSIEVPVDLTLPSAGAAYVLKIDLVDEHICWFEDRGNRPVYLAV